MSGLTRSEGATVPLLVYLARHRRLVRQRCGPRRALKRKVTIMNAGRQLLVAGALLGALLTSNAARAENGGVGSIEKWNCTVTKASGNNNQPVQYSLQEGVLIAQPLGAPRYQLLDNTKYGIIAVDRAGDLDPLYGFLNIYVATVMIDRENGHFSSTLSHSGHAPEFQTGKCNRQDANAGPTVGTAMVGK